MKYHKIKAILITCILLVQSINLAGQTLDEYLQTAGENNPGLRASFLEYHASLERVPQVGALPDPEISFGVFLSPMERYAGNQVADITLMQMFPWFGTLGAARDEATQMALARYEMFREKKSMLWYDVKQVWWNLHLIETETEIIQEQIDLLETIEELATYRLLSGGGSITTPSPASNPSSDMASTGMGSTGMSGMGNTESSPQSGGSMSMSGGGSSMSGSSGSMADILRLRLEYNDLQTQLEFLAERRAALQIRFNQLLNRSQELPVNLSGDLSFIPDTDELIISFDSVRQNNPALEMYRKEESAYAAMGQMNRRMGMPMLGVGLNYGIFEPRPGGESMMNGDNMLMPMVTLSIPIWRGKYNASVKEAEFMRQSAAKQQENVENTLISDFHDAITNINDAKRKALLFEEQTTLANQVLDILITRYSVGDTEFEEIMRLQQQLAGYRLSKAQALVNLHMAVAGLERMAGK